MTFYVESIKFELGEIQIPVRDICLANGKSYERLIKRSGFKNVYRTLKSAEVFFESAILEHVKLEQKDYVVFINQSLSSSIPGKVPKIFVNKWLNDSVGFLEISDGCTGFVRGLTIANALLESNTTQRVHIVTCEKYSQFFDNSDESVSPIFSDAVSVTTLTKHGPHRLIGTNFKNSFDNRDKISTFTNGTGFEKMRMEGAQVLSWSTSEVPKSIQSLLTDFNLSIPEIRSWYLHQGSKIVVESIVDRLAIDGDNLFTAGAIGNTGSCSIPIMLSENAKRPEGNYFPNGFSILCGFGIGLSAVTALIETT